MRANRFQSLGLTVAVCALALPGLAMAQLPSAATGSAEPGRAEQRLRDKIDGATPDVAPEIKAGAPAPAAMPAGADKVTFRLGALEVTGATVYPEGALAPFYAASLGQTITLADLYGIAAALTAKYRNDGYILTQVVVPPQTIDGGTARLQVVEGFIDKVSIEGPQSQGADLIRIYASRTRTGAPLNVRELERALLLVNDLPGVSARGVLAPSASTPGAADLTVVFERDPWDGLAAADTYGSRYLGPVQLTGALGFNNTFDRNERITAQTVLAPDPDSEAPFELGYFSVGYSEPLGTWGTSWNTSFSKTLTEPGFRLEEFDVRGLSSYFRIGLEHPFIRNRAENLSARAFFDWRDVSTRNNIEATRRDHIRAVRAGGRYEFLDSLFGIGVNSADLEIAQGLDVFGASDEGDANLSRTLGDPTFTKAEAEVQRLQRVTGSINLLLGLRGQWSNDPLLASEEFGVGGMGFGRGYDSSEIVGDDGIAGKVELQWNRPWYIGWLSDYQLFAFWDGGKVWNADATTSAGKKASRTSTGLGFRADLTPETRLDFTLAKPLSDRPDAEDDKGPRAFIGLSHKF